MAGITRAEVAHLARLARIDLTETELEHLSPQLDEILQWVGQVGEVTGDDVPPTSHPLPIANVFRSDEVQPCLDRDEALAGAPAQEDHQFKVPRILSEEA